MPTGLGYEAATTFMATGLRLQALELDAYRLVLHEQPHNLGKREQEGPMGATEGTHAGGEFLLRPMGVGLREHGKLRGCSI